jgi:Na+-transporting methylmalonyl-CoA/oxaloacetate decarboxylase gamma subunit
MSNISTALWITALGMGLVFGAIIVLWLMMVLLTAVSKEKTSDSVSSPVAAPAPSGIPLTDGHQKAQAAAIAVAMALAEREICSARALPEPPTAIVSAWQLGMRTRLLAEKGHTRRNSR